ncbi:MAG: fatty acid desaturase [Rhodobacteraceae bacterium]|nr:fatty acid desaturase [Paracoccaceae bacterium]
MDPRALALHLTVPLLLAGISASLLAAGAVLGGWWLRGALVWLTALVWLGDALLPRGAARTVPAPSRLARATPVAVALMHLALLPLLALGLAGLTGLSGAERAALFAAGALFAGQVGVAAGHELIHHSGRAARALGMVVFASILFGHHATAHGAVHHVHVATARDPNTARRGESLWAFLPRAWAGSFAAGYRVGRARHMAAGRGWAHHPYVAQVTVSALVLALGAALAGAAGAAALAAIGLAAQAQLLITDYVQHYGLRRATGPDGRPEPGGPAHSWNARHRLSGALLLSGPLHSDHHTRPGLDWSALGLPAGAPLLPASLPAMGAAALVPPLWRWLMHPRLDRWDATRATDSARADTERTSR